MPRCLVGSRRTREDYLQCRSRPPDGSELPELRCPDRAAVADELEAIEGTRRIDALGEDRLPVVAEDLEHRLIEQDTDRQRVAPPADWAGMSSGVGVMKRRGPRSSSIDEELERLRRDANHDLFAARVREPETGLFPVSPRQLEL